MQSSVKGSLGTTWLAPNWSLNVLEPQAAVSLQQVSGLVLSVAILYIWLSASLSYFAGIRAYSRGEVRISGQPCQRQRGWRGLAGSNMVSLRNSAAPAELFSKHPCLPTGSSDASLILVGVGWPVVTSLAFPFFLVFWNVTKPGVQRDCSHPSPSAFPGPPVNLGAHASESSRDSSVTRRPGLDLPGCIPHAICLFTGCSISLQGGTVSA